MGMHAVVYLEAEGADAQGCLSRSLYNLAGGLAVPTQGRAFARVTTSDRNDIGLSGFAAGRR